MDPTQDDPIKNLLLQPRLPKDFLLAFSPEVFEFADRSLGTLKTKPLTGTILTLIIQGLILMYQPLHRRHHHPPRTSRDLRIRFHLR